MFLEILRVGAVRLATNACQILWQTHDEIIAWAIREDLQCKSDRFKVTFTLGLRLFPKKEMRFNPLQHTFSGFILSAYTRASFFKKNNRKLKCSKIVVFLPFRHHNLDIIDNNQWDKHLSKY